MASQLRIPIGGVPTTIPRDGSISQDTAWPDSLPPNQDLVDIDRALRDVCSLLNNTRQALAGFSVYVQRHAGFENAYYQEQQLRVNLAQAYEMLHAKHGKVLKEVQDLERKTLVLQQELGNTKEAMAGLTFTHTLGEGGGKREILETRIVALESENSKMRLDHQGALVNAVDHIHQIQKRADELEALHRTCPNQNQATKREEILNEKGDMAASARKGVKSNRSRKKNAVVAKRNEIEAQHYDQE